MRLSVWIAFGVAAAVAVVGFVLAGQRASASREAAPVPPVNPQPCDGREPDGTSAEWSGVVAWRNAAGERVPPPVSAPLQKILNAGLSVAPGLEIRESFNTTGKVESVVEDGADRYLLTRDGDGTLRVVLARKGQPNETLAVIRRTWRAEVPQ